MNRLQKNHKSSLKRKAKQVTHRKFHSAKTGRKKVQEKQREELMKKIEEMKAKEALESNKNATNIDSVIDVDLTKPIETTMVQ